MDIAKTPMYIAVFFAKMRPATTITYIKEL